MIRPVPVSSPHSDTLPTKSQGRDRKVLAVGIEQAKGKQ